MNSNIQYTGYVLLRPVRVDLPDATGNLDLDGYLNVDMLGREQTAQKIGHVSPSLLRPHFMPHKSFELVKLAKDEKVILHGPLVVFARAVQQTINYLFSRNPDQYMNSQLTAFTVMSHIPAGDTYIASADIIDFQNFTTGKKQATISTVYTTDIPINHFPGANKKLNGIMKCEGAELADSEELPNLLHGITSGMKPLVYQPGDIVVHSNAGVRRSGCTNVAVNRMFQCTTLRPDNDCRTADTQALINRLKNFGLS